MSDLFDGVPEGTTHRNGRVLYKFTDDAVFIWSGGRWAYSAPPSEYEDGSMDEIVARPKQWSGPQDGLPPVGITCMYEPSNWERCIVVAHLNGRVAFTCPDDEDDERVYIESRVGQWAFRPIKTPDQLAAEQRETAIADMAKVLPGAKHECWTCNPDGSVKPYENTYEILGLLVDAGFKREVV